MRKIKFINCWKKYKINEWSFVPFQIGYINCKYYRFFYITILGFSIQYCFEKLKN